MNNSTINRRTNRMVDPRFQRGLVYRIGGMALFYFLFCVLVSVAMPMAFAIFTSDRSEALSEVAWRLDVLFKVLLAPLVVTFGALCVHGFQETFRIAGPNYRFRTVFQQLHRRMVPRGVRIRKDDYLQDTAAALDEALVSLHDELALLLHRARRADQALTDEAGGGQPDRSHAQELVRDMVQSLERFELVGPAPGCQPLEAGAASSDSTASAGDDAPAGETQDRPPTQRRQDLATAQEEKATP